MTDHGDGPRPKKNLRYRPLTPQFIRVLEVEAGDVSDPIVGRLVQQAIDGNPYEAVSYVWGDTRNRRDITVDGARLSVTANLHGALTAFRLPRPPPSGEKSDDAYPGDDSGGGDGAVARTPDQAQPRVRRLWADAVSINQEDLQERTSQVELMARIFAGARRVLAWLGWERGEDDRRHARAAIRFIHSFMDDPEAGLREARVLLLNPDGLSEDGRRRFEEQARAWEAVKAFFEIEYFHRTWIVQELGLAREAVLYTALQPADGEDRDRDRDRAVELDAIDWPVVGGFVRFTDYRAASLVTHLGLLSWVAHHILMVWETDEDGTPACDFLTGMHWARILRVTDPRDRVYSLLGHPLAVLDGELVVRPDYTVTRGVVYTRLAANFIRKTRNLYVLSLVDHENHPREDAEAEWDPEDDGRMPTWAPDWHSINRTTPFDYPVPAAETEDPGIRIVGETERCAKGAPLPHLLVRGWIVDEVAAVSRRMETTDFPITNLVRERAKVNPFWLDRAWEMVCAGGRCSTDRDALATLEALSLALPLGTQEGYEPVRRATGPQQTLEEHRRSFAAYVLEYHELRRRASAVGESGSDVDSHMPARSLYDSLPAGAQAELRRRAKGATSEGFLECMTWLSMCRVLYCTRSGLVGMGSRVTRPGDAVCRVRGSSAMMTLRRLRNAGVTHGPRADADAQVSCVYIGPTVLPSRIRKGVVDGGEFGEESAHFRIV